MRVATWNLGANSAGYAARHAEAWEYVLEQLRPDVALLQQAVPPVGIERSLVFARPWASRRWGSVVVTAPGRIKKGFTDTSRGPVVVAELDDGLVVGSIHARIVEGRTIPSLQKTIHALAPLLQDRRFVLGGDLNTARGAESIWPGHGHLEFFESLTGRGLFDCFWELNEHTEKRSFWGHVSPHELQLDHLFTDVSTGSEGRVKTCSILDTPEIRELSDHAPVIAEIDL